MRKWWIDSGFFAKLKAKEEASIANPKRKDLRFCLLDERSQNGEMEEVGIDELRLALDEINRRLSGLVEKHELDESGRNHLIDWIKRVLDKLTVNYRNVTKGVDELMGGYILHTRTDDILDEGRMEGRIEGRIEGVQVINYLWEHNRGEDAKRAANDKEYLNQLMAEIGAEVLAK